MHLRHLSWRLVMSSLLWSAVAFGSAGIAFAVAVPGTPAGGAPGFILEFDEVGHGQLILPGPGGGLFPNPGVPQIGGGLEFTLPVNVIPGDVIVTNVDDVSVDNPTGFSDLLTFFNVGPNGILLYRSLQDEAEPHPDAADVLGLVFPATPFGTPETGPEGNNGFVWIVGDPAGPSYTVYNGISDVPEPSTIVLGGLGLASLFLIGRRRRRAA
jgi:hypothetical protein